MNFRKIKVEKTYLLCFVLCILLGLSSYIEKTPEASTKITAINNADLKTGKNMYVKGRFLYTANHEKVILRGINEMFIWSTDHTGKDALKEISKTGANGVRLVWTTEGKPEELDLLIGNCLQNKILPIVELHDATGDLKKLPKVIDYWKKPEIIQLMNKYQKWVLLNIANEAGDGNTPDTVFLSSYKNAISELRSAGYKIPLIIDASQWGQDEKMILRTWRQLRAHDPLQNVMFSVHTYWVDANSEQRIDRFLSQVIQDTIPFLFGEGPEQYGWDCKTPFPYLYCLEQCQKFQIGWLTWSWGAMKNGDCNTTGAFDMTKDGICGNWNNDWGRLIASDDKNSIKNTSVRPKSLVRAFEE
jgi:mannan endo-1,4-beta-mannosidase